MLIFGLFSVAPPKNFLTTPLLGSVLIGDEK